MLLGRSLDTGHSKLHDPVEATCRICDRSDVSFNSREQSCRQVCSLDPAIAQKLFGQRVVRKGVSLLVARSCTLALGPRTTATAMVLRLVDNVAVQRNVRRRLRRRSSRGRSRTSSIPVNVSKLQFPRSLLAAGVA